MSSNELALIAPQVIGRVLARSIAGPSGCVLWVGDKNPGGYGQISFKHRKRSVHRIAFTAFHGPIPEGLEVDHLCRVRHCVNPHHLEAVTHAENLRRTDRNWVVVGGRCESGHLYTPENLYQRPNGRLTCRECKRRRNQEYKRRQRAANRGESR